MKHMTVCRSGIKQVTSEWFYLSKMEKVRNKLIIDSIKAEYNGIVCTTVKKIPGMGGGGVT